MHKFVLLLSERLDCKVVRKYFAASHGTGVLDGTGAKSVVRKRVMSKGAEAAVVQNSVAFFKVVDRDMSGVTAVHIIESEIEECAKAQNPWQDVKDADGISKMHGVPCSICSKVEIFKT